MHKVRLIGCVVARDGWAVQSIEFKRYLPVGRPEIAVEYLGRWDADEICLLDISRAGTDRGPDLAMVERCAARRFLPMSVGGGISSVETIRKVLSAGADKVSLNTAVVEDPELIREGARIFGVQCIVVSIDARRTGDRYEVFTRGGRKGTGLDPIAWAKEAERLGAGEILLDAIDRDGSKKGFDLELVRNVSKAVQVPVIAMGGAGHINHFSKAVRAGASAVAAANMLHFTEHSVITAKEAMRRASIPVRRSVAGDYVNAPFDEMGRLDRKEGVRFNQIELPA